MHELLLLVMRDAEIDSIPDELIRVHEFATGCLT